MSTVFCGLNYETQNRPYCTKVKRYAIMGNGVASVVTAAFILQQSIHADKQNKPILAIEHKEKSRKWR